MNFQTWIAAVTAASATGSAAVMFLVSGLKWLIPASVKGNEQRTAIILGLAVGLVSGIVAHSMTAANFPAGWMGWLAAIGTGLFVGVNSGVGGQLAHDKLLNTVLGKGGDDKEDKPAADAGGAAPAAGADAGK